MNWRMAAGIGLVYFTITGLCFFGMVVSDRTWGEPSAPLTVFGLALLALAWPSATADSAAEALALLVAQSAVAGVLVAAALHAIRMMKGASNRTAADGTAPSRRP